MDDFLELGLEVCDKVIDKGFDKLPDRIVSPLGADIPHPHIFHRNKKGELVNQKGEVQKDNQKNREKEKQPSRQGSERDREVGAKPSMSATMPSDYNGRPRRRDNYPESDGSNHGENGYRRNRNIDRRPSRRERSGYAPSQSDRLDPYAPNPNYSNQVATRPPMTSRRSQSYQPPRERRRRRSRDRTPSPSSSGSGVPPAENKALKVMSNPYAAGALGALTGGLIANQAGKASGLDSKRRSKSQSSNRRRPGEGDEAVLTLAGMILGGVTAAFGSERYQKFLSQKAEERRLLEKNLNNDGRLAQEDWDREHHEAETEVGGWAKSQTDVYPEQIREAKRWQAQVEAGERERERMHRDDVVVLENSRRREQPRHQKVYREERIYQPQPEYVTRQVVERIEEPIGYERRSRRRSFDDSRSERRREMDIRDNNYGFESRQRDRYVASGGR